jgi:2-hydroxychromene-2-carboxylate isomerase
MKQLIFYFDYISPFSYFAWLRLQDFKDTNIIYRPVALGPLLNHWGIKGPGEVTPKREFLLKQCLRYAHKANIPFTTPKTHPFNSLYALRLSLSSVGGELQPKIIQAQWKAGWQNRIDMADPEELKLNLSQAGLAAEELFEKSFSREARTELKSNIQMALDAGVFGVPSMVIGEELFWGNDSLEDVMAYLDGKDVLDKNKFQTLLASTPRAASQQL